ncbi:MAG TPA: tetratricopeptide repeat protein [Tepidisphaeraceae bacterium]|nr:tetratricopeptide repeat protein [Tepidisphaeraceae bacterium]
MKQLVLSGVSLILVILAISCSNGVTTIADAKRIVSDETRVIELNPNDAVAYYTRGKAEWFDNAAATADFNKAIQLYSRTIESNPNDAVAYCGRGDAEAAKWEEERAVLDYFKAVELDPKNRNKYMERAESVYATDAVNSQIGGNMDYANAAFAIVHKLQQGGPDARGIALIFSNLGAMRGAAGALDRSIVASSRAIEIDPDFWAAYQVRGSAEQAKGDTDAAIADFTKAVQRAPPTPTDALVLSGSLAYNYKVRASAKLFRGDFDGAIADCTKAVELRPGESVPAFGEIYRIRGDARKAKGDLRGANADHAKAIELKYSPAKAVGPSPITTRPSN